MGTRVEAKRTAQHPSCSRSRPDGCGEGDRERLIIKLQSYATGSHGNFSIGGDDLLTPYGRAAWASDVLLAATPSGGDIYSNRDDRFLRDL
jgi:hypothetical protein